MRLGLSLVLLAACGDVSNNHHIVDSALSGDAQNDAPGSTSAVTVTMKDSLGAIVNSKVYFQGNDSTLIATVATDANGVASAGMPDGGYVTIVDPDSTTTGAVRTWAGVKNGDSLIYDTSRAAAVNSTVSFSLPRFPANAFAVTYTVSTPCGSTPNVSPPAGVAGAFPVAVVLTCGPTTDVLVEVLDPNLKLLDTLFVADQPVSNGATVDYGAKAYVAAVTRNFSLNNNVAAKAWTVTDRFEVAQGGFFTASSTGTAANPSTASLIEPALPANTLDLLTLRQVANNTALQIESWGPTGGTVALDISQMLLPNFGAAPTFDVASHTAVWTQTPNTATADFTEAVLVITRGETPVAAWAMITPNTMSAPFPVLPGDAATYNVLASDTVRSAVELVKYPGGWDAARPALFQSSSEPPGATGTLLTSTYQALTP